MRKTTLLLSLLDKDTMFRTLIERFTGIGNKLEKCYKKTER